MTRQLVAIAMTVAVCLVSFACSDDAAYNPDNTGAGETLEQCLQRTGSPAACEDAQ